MQLVSLLVTSVPFLGKVGPPASPNACHPSLFQRVGAACKASWRLTSPTGDVERVRASFWPLGGRQAETQLTAYSITREKFQKLGLHEQVQFANRKAGAPRASGARDSRHRLFRAPSCSLTPAAAAAVAARATRCVCVACCDCNLSLPIASEFMPRMPAVSTPELLPFTAHRVVLALRLDEDNDSHSSFATRWSCGIADPVAASKYGVHASIVVSVLRLTHLPRHLYHKRYNLVCCYSNGIARCDTLIRSRWSALALVTSPRCGGCRWRTEGIPRPPGARALRLSRVTLAGRPT